MHVYRATADPDNTAPKAKVCSELPATLFPTVPLYTHAPTLLPYIIILLDGTPRSPRNRSSPTRCHGLGIAGPQPTRNTRSGGVYQYAIAATKISGPVAATNRPAAPPGSAQTLPIEADPLRKPISASSRQGACPSPRQDHHIWLMWLVRSPQDHGPASPVFRSRRPVLFSERSAKT